MTTVFPGALDSLPRPASNTKRNASGFELHTVIDNLSDAVEAAEAKVGISESSAQDSPLANTVLQSLTNGKSKWATIITAMLAANAVTQAQVVTGVTSGPTTTSTSPVDMTNMSITMTVTGGPCLMFFVGEGSNSGANFNEYQLLANGVQVFAISQPMPAGGIVVTPMFGMASPAAGSRIFKVQWNVTAGTGTMVSTVRTLMVVELKR